VSAKTRRSMFGGTGLGDFAGWVHCPPRWVTEGIAPPKRLPWWNAQGSEAGLQGCQGCLVATRHTQSAPDRVSGEDNRFLVSTTRGSGIPAAIRRGEACPRYRSLAPNALTASFIRAGMSIPAGHRVTHSPHPVHASAGMTNVSYSSLPIGC